MQRAAATGRLHASSVLHNDVVEFRQGFGEKLADLLTGMCLWHHWLVKLLKPVCTTKLGGLVETRNTLITSVDVSSHCNLCMDR